MPRTAKFYGNEVPATVAKAVYALIADYDRRVRAIMSDDISRETKDNLVGINTSIDAAFAEIEQTCKIPLMIDISKKRGYEKSSLASCMSRNAYYRRKMKVVHDIAKNLMLI